MADSRKHRLQMKLAEIAAVEAFVRVPRRWACSENEHLQERLREKQITVAGIAAALKAGKLVEVNRNGQDVRAVVREQGQTAQTVVVVSLCDFRIVTAWKNHQDDRHTTLDRHVYCWREDIREVLNLD